MKKVFFYLVFVLLFSSNSHLLPAQDTLSKKVSYGINAQLRLSYSPFDNTISYAAGPLIKVNGLYKTRMDVETGILFSKRRLEDSRGVRCFAEPCPQMTFDYLYLEFPLLARYYLLKDSRRNTLPVFDIGLQPALLIGGIEKEYWEKSNDNYVLISTKHYSLFKRYDELRPQPVNIGLVLGAGIIIKGKKFSFHTAARFQLEPIIFREKYSWMYDMTSLSIVFSAYY